MTTHDAKHDTITTQELVLLREENARLRRDLTELARLVVEQNSAAEARRRHRRRTDAAISEHMIARLHPDDTDRF